MVTDTYSGGAATALAAGCTLRLGDDTNGIVGINSSTVAHANSIIVGFANSLLGWLECSSASAASGPYSADIRMSFTAGGA